MVVQVGGTLFRAAFHDPDFDIQVRNDFGFAGSDGYGFVSRANRARGVLSQNFDRLDVGWQADTFDNRLFETVELPLVPPDLRVLGGGLLTVEGECTPCAGPAAFFRIRGTMTALFSLPHPTTFGLGAETSPFAAEDPPARAIGPNGPGLLVPEPTAAVVWTAGLVLLALARRSRASEVVTRAGAEANPSGFALAEANSRSRL